MARNTELTSFDEQTVEVFDEDASEYLAYGSAPSTAVREYSPPEDMPLFLSNEIAEPRQRGFGSGGNRNLGSDLGGASVLPRLIKASVLVAAAAGIAFAITSVENPFALFANAKASLNGATPVQSDAAERSASEPAIAAQAAPAQPVPASPSNIGAPPPSARTAPTHDEIALALKAAARQNPPEIRQPAATPPAPPPVRRLDADELATLLTRAKGLIAIGDIAPARLLLERAADAQEASAALLLAQTYDPAVVGTPDARSIAPDPVKARDWYRKAAQFGSKDAQQRLSQMRN